MAPIFWVDLPDHQNPGFENAWVNVAILDTREEAEKWLEQMYGVPKDQAAVFISEGSDDLDLLDDEDTEGEEEEHE